MLPPRAQVGAEKVQYEARVQISWRWMLSGTCASPSYSNPIQYSCSPTDGLLYVHLFNNTATYPCYHRDQVRLQYTYRTLTTLIFQLITVRRIVNGWLHEGSIVCPDCSSMCSKCAPPPKRAMHIEDATLRVPCAASRVVGSVLLLFALILRV